MPIDINIKCIKQTSKVINYNKELFFLEKLNDNHNDITIYNDNWFLYNSIIGIGYNLYLKESQNTTYNLVDFKEKTHTALYIKHILFDEKEPSNGNLDSINASVIFNKNYINEFERLMKQVVNSSKNKTCVLFFRLQTSRPEQYVGRISLDQFISLLKKEEIYLNVAYIVSEANYD